MKDLKLISITFLLALSAFCTFSSCASKEKNNSCSKNGIGELFVVDEKSQIVEGFKFCLTSCENEYLVVNGFTASDGKIDIQEGNWHISGMKNGYTRLENQKVKMNGNEILFVQVCSVNSELEKAAAFYKYGDYEDGLKCLSEIYAIEGSDVARVVNYYREVGERLIRVEGENKNEED